MTSIDSLPRPAGLTVSLGRWFVPQSFLRWTERTPERYGDAHDPARSDVCRHAAARRGLQQAHADHRPTGQGRCDAAFGVATIRGWAHLVYSTWFMSTDACSCSWLWRCRRLACRCPEQPC